MRRLLRRILDIRAIRNKLWYLPILLLPVVSLGATYGLMVLTGVRFQPQPAIAVSTAVLFVPVFFVAAVGEELGWSGYVLEPLQQRWGALGGSVVLGLVWWCFHVPPIVQSGQGPTLVVLGAVGAVVTRVLWAWLFNNTGGSVFAIVVVHTISNMCGAYVPSVSTAANAPVAGLLAVLVIVLWGPRTLARFQISSANMAHGENRHDQLAG